MLRGVDAAEEVLPGIKNDLLSGKYKPKETDCRGCRPRIPGGAP